MKTITLPVKAIYFDEIKAGTKTEEYRRVCPHWSKRLEFVTPDQVVITKGYPKRDDTERRLVFPWRGFTVKTITHEFFGPEPVEVFAIKVSNQGDIDGRDTEN